MSFPEAAFIAKRPANHTGEILVSLIHTGNSAACDKRLTYSCNIAEKNGVKEMVPKAAVHSGRLAK